MKILCLIPARGGSKRVPLKNILPICGRPALAWTIDHARECSVEMTIAVLTDNPQIAAVASGLGVTVIDEPAELAQDEVDDSRLWIYALETLEEGGEEPFDLTLDLGACTPVRPAGIVEALIDMIRATGCDYCQTVTAIPTHYHPFRAATLDAEGKLQNLDPVGCTLKSERYSRLYVYTGAGLAITRDALARLNGRAALDESETLDRRGLIHAADDCIEIDVPQDVPWAEFQLSRRLTHVGCGE